MRCVAWSQARSLALGPCSGCGDGEWLVGIVMASMNFDDCEQVHDVPPNDYTPFLLLQHDKMAQNTFSPSWRR